MKRSARRTRAEGQIFRAVTAAAKAFGIKLTREDHWRVLEAFRRIVRKKRGKD